MGEGGREGGSEGWGKEREGGRDDGEGRNMFKEQK